LLNTENCIEVASRPAPVG